MDQDKFNRLVVVVVVVVGVVVAGGHNGGQLQSHGTHLTQICTQRQEFEQDEL